MPPVRDVTIGRFMLPTIQEDELVESLGDTVDVVGPIVNAGERRARPFPLKFRVNPSGDTNPYTSAERMRRQARSLFDNSLLLQYAIYLELGFDLEQDGWMVLGGGDLAYEKGGVSLGEYSVTLRDAYRVGSTRSHRPARRVEVFNRTDGVTPRDILGTQFSTHFSTVVSSADSDNGPRYHLPRNATDKRLGRFNATTGNDTYQGVMGTASVQRLASTRSGSVASFELAETDLIRANDDVAVFDRRGGRDGVVFAPADTALVNQHGNPRGDVSQFGYSADAGSGTGGVTAVGNSSDVYDGKTVVACNFTVGSTNPNNADLRWGGLPSGNVRGPAVVPGQIWWANIAGKLAAASGTYGALQGIVIWRDNAGSAVGTSTFTLAATPVIGTWYEASGAFVAPAGATFAGLALRIANIQGASTCTLRSSRGALIQVPSLTYPATYVDGYSVGGTWELTPGVSRSAWGTFEESAFGWEEVFGPNYPLSGVPVLQNGHCRLRNGVGTNGSDLAFFVDSFIPDTTSANAGYAWFERGGFYLTAGPTGNGTASGSNAVNPRVVECTPERAVVAYSLISSSGGRAEVYVTLQRGWTGPRFELYWISETAGGQPLLRYVPAQTGEVGLAKGTGASPTLYTSASGWNNADRGNLTAAGCLPHWTLTPDASLSGQDNLPRQVFMVQQNHVQVVTVDGSAPYTGARRGFNMAPAAGSTYFSFQMAFAANAGSDFTKVNNVAQSHLWDVRLTPELVAR